MRNAEDDGAKVVSLKEARDARKHVFTLTDIDEDEAVEEIVWVTEGVQENAGATRIALEAPPDTAGWALTVVQARRVATALLDAAQSASEEV